MGQARSCFLSVESLRFVFEGQGAERGQKMDMKLRVFAVIVTMIVGGFIVGCGSEDDTEDSPIPTVEKEPAINFGLDGDTYRNRRLFKVSNLPVDDWTIKEVTNKVRGEADNSPGTINNTTISLLLMQPTSEDNFADTLDEAFEKGIPYIYIAIEVQSISDVTSSREVALIILKQTGFQENEVTNQGAIFSKDRRHGYFWEVTFESFKAKQSFFVRSSEGSRYIYRLLFLSPPDQYDAYVSVFDKIVSSVEFRL